MFTLENQLWLWLEECDDRKPRSLDDDLLDEDKVVRLLQEESVRGREASEAGDSSVGLSSKLQ